MVVVVVVVVVVEVVTSIITGASVLDSSWAFSVSSISSRSGNNIVAGHRSQGNIQKIVFF